MADLEAILPVLLIVVCLGSTLLTVFQLPGTWFIVMAAAGYGWYSGWTRFGWKTVAVLAGVALVAEVAENVAAVILAKKGGASRRAAWYGLIGGMFGALVFSVPIPIIGTVIGAALGCFAGAMAGELSLHRDSATGVRVGIYAAIGRIIGTMLKITAAVIMTAIVVVSLLL